MFYNIQSYCKRTEEFQRFCVRGQIGLSTHNYGSRYFAGWRRRRKRRRRMKTIRNDKNAATGNNSTSKIQMWPLELHSFQIPICGSRWRQRQMATTTTMTLTTATIWTKGIFKLFENKLLTLFSKRKYFKERLAAWLEKRMEWWIPKIKTWQKFYTQKVKTLQRRAP